MPLLYHAAQFSHKPDTSYVNIPLPCSVVFLPPTTITRIQSTAFLISINLTLSLSLTKSFSTKSNLSYRQLPVRKTNPRKLSLCVVSTVLYLRMRRNIPRSAYYTSSEWQCCGVACQDLVLAYVLPCKREQPRGHRMQQTALKFYRMCMQEMK